MGAEAASQWPGQKIGGASEAESPGIGGYALEAAKQVGLGAAGNVAASLQGLSPRSEENRGLQAAIAAIRAGKDIQEAVQEPPVPAGPLTEEPLYQAGQAVQRRAEEILRPSGSLHPLVQDVARGFGSVGANIASAFIPGGAAMIPLQGIGEAAQTAVQKGATPDQQERAARLGTVAGITDFADLLLPSLGSTGKALGLVGRVGLRALEGAFVEGGQEGLQQFIQNAIAQGVYKPDQDLWEDVPRSAFVGAIVGGGTSSILGGHGQEAQRPATEQEIAAAGQALTQPLEQPATAAPVQGELPLGPPPAVQGELPLGPMGQMVDSEIGKLRAAGDLTPAPSDSDAIVRGKGVADLLESDIAARGPLESRPQNVEIPTGPAPELTAAVGLAPEPAAAGIPMVREKGRLVKTGAQLDILFEGSPRIKFRAVHSTVLSNLLPKIDLKHLQGKPVSQAVSNVLTQALGRLIPNQPIHIVTDQDMRRVSEGASGVYLPGIDAAQPNRPILIAASELSDPARFTYVLLHEATHALTSNIMLHQPETAVKVRMLMDAAQKHLVETPEGGMYVPYGFKNEREFIAEAYSDVEFQNFLAKHQAPRELVKALGMEKKLTLWQAFVHSVRQMLGLPDTREVMTLLEATLRAGADIADQQAAQVAEMQRRFNEVEPQLDAVKRQPETKGVYDMISGLGDLVPADVRPELVRQAGYADKMNQFYKYMLHAFQLGELNPHVADLQRYLEKMREAAVDEAKINDAALRIMKDWQNIGREQSEGLVNFIDDITNMTYRSQQEIGQGISRKPTTQEFNALARKYKLNAQALDVFSKINKMFDTFLDLSSQLAREEAMKITDPAQRAKALDAVNANVRSLKARPYFPFMRYGRHVVLVRNAKGVVVWREHFERRGLRSAKFFQEQAAVQLRKQFPAPQYKIDFDVMSESSAPMVGMPGMMLDLMAQKLALSDRQLKALEQLRFEISAAQSFKHRFQHKSYVKGYSRDFQRSFAQYFFHGAKWYVKTKYADGMRGDIARVKAGADVSLTPVKRIELSQFLDDHLENNFLNPKQDFIHFKAGLVTMTLAFVPVSAAVNMSQVPMVSLPYLGAKFGDARAGAALTKAIANARNYYTKGNLGTMTADAARALNYAIQTGRLEQTLGAELASWAQGGNLGVGYGGSTISRTVHSMMEKGMWMFSVAEKWNRRITFAAARELALAQPNSKYVKETLTRYHDELQSMLKAGFAQHEAEAILVASHVVDQTQFMGTQESRPRFMRGKFGTVFLYKRFVQGLMFLTLNNKRDFAPRFMLMALMMAGLQGLPGYDDLKEIARALGWWLYGKDFDLNREIRRLVRDMTDEQWAPDQVLHGFARIGFGVPWLLNLLGNAAGQSPTVNERMNYPHGPDVSRSIGLGGAILPIEVGKLFGPPISEPEKMFGEQSARAGGVMGNLAFNYYRAIMSKDQPGDFKRWELMMPRFAKNLSSAYRAYSEEKVRGRNDTAIVRFDTRDPEHLGEIVGMAGGFQPRRVTSKWEELRDQSEVGKFFDTTRGMLLEQWTSAVRGGRDPQEMERVRTATQEFNANVPTWAAAMRLTPDTIQKSVLTRLKTQQMQEAGLSPQMNKLGIVRETQRLHPESVVDVRKVGP